MRPNPPVTPLLVALGGMLLAGCQTNTVYFASHYPYTIEHVSAKGGTPEVLIAGPANVTGLAYSPREKRLYLADHASISRWRMDGKDDGAVGFAEWINGMALDEKAGRLYWAELGSPPDQGRGRVVSSNLQGGDRRVLVSQLSHPRVAVNPAKGVLYWTQEGDSGGVWLAKLDGTGKRRIADVDTLPASLAVDSKGGTIFWVSVESSDIPATITAAGADGSNAKVIVTLPKGWIEGLAVDEDARRIVWLERTNSAPARIRSARFDGTSAMTIHEFTGEHFARAVAVGPPRKT